MNLVQLKFPIGKFEPPNEYSSELINQWIHDIEKFPSRIKQETQNLSEQQLETVYRPKGWTIRQVVHHCADSHLNSITRFKLALTEDKPTIRPYFEDRWAELPDSKNLDIFPSLQIIQGVHNRWVVLLKSLTTTDLEKEFVHPEHGRSFTIKEAIGSYAWHCNHHLAHITTLKKSKGWD